MNRSAAPCILLLVSLLACLVQPLAAQDEKNVQPVDPGTLTGKVMVGYQGWFNCPKDGSELGWKHWARLGIDNSGREM